MFYLIGLIFCIPLLFILIKGFNAIFKPDVHTLNLHFYTISDEIFFEKWDSFLYKFNLYYRNLNEEGRIKFNKRLKELASTILVVGKENLQITDEIKIILLSYIVQLTYGLKNFKLQGFEHIYLYPDEFFSKKSEESLKGATYTSKIIALSWRHFAEEYLQACDGNNVGLHQLALALSRTVSNGRNYDLSFGSYLDKWFEIASAETKQKANIANDFFADLNIEDRKQFFAKSVECFFEIPEQLRLKLPNTYAHLSLLLNQDLLNSSDNYSYKKERFNNLHLVSHLPQKIKKTFKYRDWHWSYNIVFLGLLLSPIFFYFLLHNVAINLQQLLYAIIIGGIVASGLFYSLFKEMELFTSYKLFLVYCMLGLAPVFLLISLSLNLFINYPEKKISIHQIESVNRNYYYDSSGNAVALKSITFYFGDQFLNDFPFLRTFESDEIPSGIISHHTQVLYEITTGLFGIPVIKNKKIITEE